MLKPTEIADIYSAIKIALDKAERDWRNAGEELIAESYSAESNRTNIPSKIPGHERVQDEETVIDEFIAFVADMRDSTKHLLCALSSKNSKVSQLQRVYYETSALLPAIATLVTLRGGGVTEYLGDGVLALFRVDNDCEEVIINTYQTAKDCIDELRDIVNEQLRLRYSLPPIDLGIGLALSKAIVTLVGIEGNLQPKAFGECVFKATKLSCKKNSVGIDVKLYTAWPRAPGGSVKHKKEVFNGETGYVCYKRYSKQEG